MVNHPCECASSQCDCVLEALLVQQASQEGLMIVQQASIHSCQARLNEVEIHAVMHFRCGRHCEEGLAANGSRFHLSPRGFASDGGNQVRWAVYFRRH